MSVLETEEAGLLVEEAACERYALEHVANNGSEPQWYDALATAETDVTGVEAGVEVECKAAVDWFQNGGARRRGRWWFARTAHERLLEAGGQYVLGVYDPETASVRRLAMLDVEWVDGELDSRWTACGPRHPSEASAQIPWGVVFTSGLEVSP